MRTPGRKFPWGHLEAFTELLLGLVVGVSPVGEEAKKLQGALELASLECLSTWFRV